MVTVLFDSNILIDFMLGYDQARQEIERHSDAAISIITWIEVMAGSNARNEAATRSFLAEFKLIDIDGDIGEYAFAVRAERKLQLPDALIVATAQATSRTLITRDVKLVNDYDDPPVRVPYEL